MELPSGIRNLFLVFAALCLAVGAFLVGVLVATPPRAESAGLYDVVCVSGGIPVLRLTAQRAVRYPNSWVFVVDGLQYEANLECILRPHQ